MRQRMDRYSHADRTALTRAVAGLLTHCDCHGSGIRRLGVDSGMPRCDPDPDTMRIRLDDGTTFCAFEPGSGIVVSPTGKVACYKTRWGQAAQRVAVEVSHLPELSADPAAAGHGTGAPEAPLPAGFRLHRLSGLKRQFVRFRVPATGHGRDGSGARDVEVGQPPAGSLEIPRNDFEGTSPTYPMGIGSDLEPMIGEHEDEMCLEKLRRLDCADETYVYRWDSTLDGLAKFVSGLNATRPREVRLDTVFINYGMYLTLFGNDLRTPSWAAGYPFYDGGARYNNMSVLGRVAFLHHPGVPHDGAYAISSRQGPVFVHGPSRIDCTDDVIEVTRRCGVVEPPEYPDVPWGVRFGVEGERDEDGQEDGGG